MGSGEFIAEPDELVQARGNLGDKIVDVGAPGESGVENEAEVFSFCFAFNLATTEKDRRRAEAMFSVDREDFALVQVENHVVAEAPLPNCVEVVLQQSLCFSDCVGCRPESHIVGKLGATTVEAAVECIRGVDVEK